MAKGMNSYSAAKIEQLDRTATMRLYGRALDFDLGDAARRWRPVQPCLCVQDSPDNPCPCPPGRTWWLRTDTILAEGDSGRKDAEGNELRYFDVFQGSQILMETMRSVTLKRSGGKSARLKSRGGKISPSTVGGIIDPRGGRGGGGAIPLMGWDDILVGFAVSLAASAVYGWLTSDDDDDEGGQDCYDSDDDMFYKC